MKTKYIYTLIFTLVFCQYGVSQDKDMSIFIHGLLQETKPYFESAKLNEVGVLKIQANDSLYASMDSGKKNAILELALKRWNGEMIFVYSKHKREIWKRDIKTGQISLIGLWNLDDAEMYKYLPKTLLKTKYHPWFCYFGGQTKFDSDNFSLLLNARFGSFLYKNRWDLALAASISDIENDATLITTAELGINSKVYFPIKIKTDKYHFNISPYIGGGLSRVYTDTYMEMDMQYSDSSYSYWNKTLLLGVSWYVNSGSLDLGLQLGDSFSLTLGYTFSL